MINLNSLNDSNPETYLYDKTYICPVCQKSFTSKTVKSKKVRLLSKETDFMPVYKEINPLFYDVVICPECGYSSLAQYFNKIKKNQIPLIKSKITPKFKFREYPEILDVESSIDRYKIALISSLVINPVPSETASIYLRLGWLYRLKKDTHNEGKFLEQAYLYFLKAYEVESPPICGMDLASAMYLIGELLRRIGNTQEALKWFYKVILSTNVTNHIKELARDQRDLIKANG